MKNESQKHFVEENFFTDFYQKFLPSFALSLSLSLCVTVLKLSRSTTKKWGQSNQRDCEKKWNKSFKQKRHDSAALTNESDRKESQA